METLLGLILPEVERWSRSVVVVRGLNPGAMTGPGTNTYLVGRGKRPLLVDTGAGIAGYVSLLERALDDHLGGAALGEILVTHAHPDHLGGAASLLRAFGSRTVAKQPWPEKDAAFEVELESLADGAVIQGDGVTLRALHMPGHSRDHLCFYLEEERALFTGDVVLGVGTSVIPIDGGDLADYLRSLERILELDLERIYPGHGPLVKRPRDVVAGYLRHRREREHQIIDAIQTGSCSVQEIVAQAYRDVPRVLHPAAAQSVLSHLRQLERERRAVRSVDASGHEHWALV
ncbi:MAG: MBL fold metallo-hydrolase [Myxococcota bacterium]